MTEFHIALFFHLLGAFSLVAGLVVAAVAFETARRRTTPREIALLLGLSRIGVLMVVAGVAAAAAFGFWLVNLGSFGGQAWVTAAVALLIALIALGAVGGQRPERARQLAHRLDEAGAETNAELRKLL